MLRHTANPAAFFHLSPYMAEQSNIGLPACNCGGGQRSSFELFGRPNGAAVAGHFRSQNADEDFAAAWVCRSYPALESVTASGLIMRPAAARSSASFAVANALRVTVSLQILFGKYAEKISPDPP